MGLPVVVKETGTVTAPTTVAAAVMVKQTAAASLPAIAALADHNLLVHNADNRGHAKRRGVTPD